MPVWHIVTWTPPYIGHLLPIYIIDFITRAFQASNNSLPDSFKQGDL